jgi:hypothetical protein
MRLRTSLTLLALAGLLVIGSLVGWRLLTEDAPPLDTGSSACDGQPDTADTELRSEEVRVNVYNAGSISGLASTTMRSLNRRGFEEGSVDNAPAGTKVKNVLLLDPEPKSAPVRLVAAQFVGDVVRRRHGDDLSEGVDIILGDDFRGVDEDAATSISLRSRTDECAPGDAAP